MLFSWYFKGFDILRHYLFKHPVGLDMENLDLEEVNREMATDEASQSTMLEGDAPETTPAPPANDDIANDS